MPEADITQVLEHLFPGQLTTQGKDRLRTAIAPFRPDPPPPAIDYYLNPLAESFLQGDLLNGVRIPLWNPTSSTFEKKFTSALLLSNSCDIAADENARPIKKQAMLAPITNAASYFQRLKTNFASSAQSSERSIKSQEISTILYLPPPLGAEEKYPEGVIVELDKVFWFPVLELMQFRSEFLRLRIASLSSWAHYLLLTKLAFHICRTPEEADRPAFS